MEKACIDTLNKLTREFYATYKSSFWKTRTRAWKGFDELANFLEKCGFASEKNKTVLPIFDCACGNLRFERFLQKRFPQSNFEFYTSDIYKNAASSQMPVIYHQLDIIDLLAKGITLDSVLDIPAAQLSVALAFMHHIPGMQTRLHFLKELCSKTAMGGYVAVTLWRFMRDAKIAENARKTSTAVFEARLCDRTKLEQGDYFLGWQNQRGVYRYCHCFSDKEIVALCSSCKKFAQLVTRFDEDGKNGDLNTYLVFQRI